MQQLEATRKELNLKDYKMRSATEQDYSTLITQSSQIYENGKIMIAYIELDTPYQEVTEALQRINYEESYRTDGLPTRSRIFGFSPRNVLRKDFCSATSLAKEAPQDHQIICDYAEQVCDRYYEMLNPELYVQHRGTTETNVVDDYRIKRSAFTSGIINKNNPLKYHFDTGNVKDVWSCMLVLRGKTLGGYLAVPEYDVAFELKNNSLLLFDGQGLLHGVTPIKKQAADAYRYSIVYYTLRQMWNCQPLDEEIIRIRKLKTQREIKRRG